MATKREQIKRVQISDLDKIFDIVNHVYTHLSSRDASNAALHLGIVRYSPLTSEVSATLDRLKKIIEEEE